MEVLGAKRAIGVVVASTSLQQVLTPTLSRKKWKISPKLSARIIIKKDIILPAIPQRM